MATQYTGDLPDHSQSTYMATPYMKVAKTSCLSFQYITISSFTVYGQFQNASKFDITNIENSEEFNAWEMFYGIIPPGIYSVVWVNQLSPVSLKAKGYESGVIYPFIMDNMHITTGECDVEESKLLCVHQSIY